MFTFRLLYLKTWGHCFYFLVHTSLFVFCLSALYLFSLSFTVCIYLNVYLLSSFSLSVFLALSKLSLSVSSLLSTLCGVERSDHCYLQDRQQTDESRSIGNKTDNKSQICSLILSAVGSEDRKGRRGGRRRSFTTPSLSICLIQIYLFKWLLSLLLYLHFFAAVILLSLFHLCEFILFLISLFAL